jgi:lipopolysaccharide/colanic/teichoic acid biosynthesis glycosyltransferase
MASQSFAVVNVRVASKKDIAVSIQDIIRPRFCAGIFFARIPCTYHLREKTMHYREYCKVQGAQELAPLGTHDFYQQLHFIAKRRATALTEIQHRVIRRCPRVYEHVQRCLDIILGVLGLIVSAIPFLAIAVAIKIDSRGPVFYRQKRVGKNGLIFEMIKFRTMTEDAEMTTGAVWAVKEDPRITRVGAWLRRLRLDELPQLFNILKGDMTFVGPRPERPEFVYQFVQHMPAFDRRHEVKPGIAGLAQIKNGYDTSPMSIYKKIRWDFEYMKRRCLMVDFAILWRTVKEVLKGNIR